MTGAPLEGTSGERLSLPWRKALSWLYAGLYAGFPVVRLARPAGRRLAAALLAERERWPLWLPVGLGAGIALYFALPVEPPPWLGQICAALALLAVVAARGRPAWFIAALAAAVVAGGFAVAQLRTGLVAAPVLSGPLSYAAVTGRVVENSVRSGGRRLVLDNVAIEGLDPAATPERVRITLRGESNSWVPGDWVGLRANLWPPRRPVAPGAFDFARKAYFERLGAFGFAYGRPHAIAPSAAESASGLDNAVGRLRHDVTGRTRAALDGQAGAMAAALLTGERGAIGEDVLTAMRNAGLAHLLAISGLHIGLVAAIVFFAVRALLALCEPLALRYAIKKWAACAAFAGTAFYLVLSGATISTQRAFLMSALVLAAILLDRTGIRLRSVAWAAAVVLLVQPESLLGPSFQMSFAAVTALVAVYGSLRDRSSRWPVEKGLLYRWFLYLAFVGLTTVIATTATAPFIVYHFNRLAVYGLAANLLAVPMMAFWIMPWGVAALVLMTFGLESWALAPMGWGIDAVIAVAKTVSGWPGSVALLPAMPMAGLVLTVGGGLWLCLWQRRWRWFGALAFAAGLLTPGLVRGPDVLVDEKGKLFAARTADGALALSSRRSARFSGKMWLRRNGQDVPAPWPGDDNGLRCDGAGCIYRAKGQVVALVRDSRALADDCRVADVVMSAVPVRRPCPSARVVIDRIDLWRGGAHALYLEANGVRVESVIAGGGERPWTPRPGGD
ncbi:MAG: ComEC/Rec2 family competence protein [Proteobacteria bacterium]|nr:ComEC/Rec2 family competence protein [Pseudomonadota bacterium]